MQIWRRNITYMTNYSVITTNTFEMELETTIHYINSILKEPIIAKNLYSKIISSISNLNYFPERYSKVFYYKDKTKNVHKLPIDNFIILYKVNQSLGKVYILHIFNSNQNYLNLL